VWGGEFSIGVVVDFEIVMGKDGWVGLALMVLVGVCWVVLSVLDVLVCSFFE